MVNQLQDYLPLTEPTFFVLLSLAPGAKHGYAIMKDIQKLSDERIQLSTGTLYGVLDRLLDSGWIARLDKPDNQIEQQTDQRIRKYYELSELGRQILKAETNRMMALVSLANLHSAAE